VNRSSASGGRRYCNEPQIVKEAKLLIASVMQAKGAKNMPLSSEALGALGENIIQRQAYFIGLLIDAE
jgi:hypothetical protein